MTLRRYIWGQSTDIQRMLNVNQPINLSMAVKTISRTHQFQLEATVAQYYSLNRVWHTAEPRDLVTESEAIEYENYFHDSDNEDYISSREKADHLIGAHNYLGKMLMSRHDQQTV